MKTLKFITKKRTVLKYGLSLMVICLLSYANTFAQLSIGGTPYSFTEEFEKNKGDYTIENMVLPAPDVEKAKKEDEDKMMKRAGMAIYTNITMETAGNWLELENGNRLWRLKITSKGATEIFAGMKDFYLPDEGLLYVYNEDRTRVFGGFSSFNNRKAGNFIFDAIEGDSFIIEYYEPKVVKGKAKFTIDRIFYGFTSFETENSYNKSTSCDYVSINSSEGNGWQTEKRGVVRIRVYDFNDNYGYCSGSLINNTNNDKTPYVLTAKHCSCDGYRNYADWNFRFNFESGSFSSLTGSNDKATHGSSDILLVQLYDQIPASYNAFWNGFNAYSALPSNVTSIHHPEGGYKRISIDNNVPDYTNDWWITDCGVLVDDLLEVNYDVGGMQKGSSGGPVFNQEKRIVGVNSALYFPYDDYPDPLCRGLYGRINFAWSVLSPFLNPSGGVYSHNGIDDSGSGPDCRTSNLAPADQATLGNLSKLIVNELGNNSTRIQKAFIKHEQEIISLLENKNTKLNTTYKNVLVEGRKLLVKSFAFKKEVLFTKAHYELLVKLLSELHSATNSKALKQELEFVLQYLPVMIDKELKAAIIALDRADDSNKELVNFNSRARLSNNQFSLIDNGGRLKLLSANVQSEGKLSLQLYSTDGSLIKTLHQGKTVTAGNHNFEIDMTGLPKGMYILSGVFVGETDQIQIAERIVKVSNSNY